MEHFQNLYSEDGPLYLDTILYFLHPIPNMVTNEGNNELCKEIYESEVIEALWSLDQDKDIGLDGFTIHFYHSYWNIIKFDLCRLLNWSKKKDKIGWETNPTFLALIPKETNPTYFGRFRPISLCNASYKIMTKIIENSLKPILQKLIVENRGGLCRTGWLWIV